jgi:hypothetical protein
VIRFGRVATGAPAITKSIAANASASSAVLPALRAQTVTRPPGFDVVGVQLKVFDVDHPVIGFQPSS